MDGDKKFKIIRTIEDDAPCGNINYCTISFLTPQKIEKINFLGIKGFKVHNGYNNDQIAHDDAKKLKDKNKSHDIYVSQLGKLYAWDDATKTDSIEYDDDKLNDLEKNRRENIDKIKLLSEQFKNEHKTIYSNVDPKQMNETRTKMREKFHKKGIITRQELEELTEANKAASNKKTNIEAMEKIKEEINECFATDYLDENDPVGLKYGCITVYSPSKIGGLKTLCFKIRGLYQTPSELNRRVRRLQTLYPNDCIYKFEIGKWTPYSDDITMDHLDMLKELNYCMKCHLDNLEHEREEFVKRKDKLKTETEQASKMLKSKNRREKIKEKRNEKRQRAQANKISNPDAPKEETITANGMNMVSDSVTSFGNAEDDQAIQNIINFLDDPELRGKFAVDQNKLQTMEVDVNQF